MTLPKVMVCRGLGPPCFVLGDGFSVAHTLTPGFECVEFYLCCIRPLARTSASTHTRRGHDSMPAEITVARMLARSNCTPPHPFSSTGTRHMRANLEDEKVCERPAARTNAVSSYRMHACMHACIYTGALANVVRASALPCSHHPLSQARARNFSIDGAESEEDANELSFYALRSESVCSCVSTPCIPSEAHSQPMLA